MDRILKNKLQHLAETLPAKTMSIGWGRKEHRIASLSRNLLNTLNHRFKTTQHAQAAHIILPVPCRAGREGERKKCWARAHPLPAINILIGQGRTSFARLCLPPSFEHFG
jgi:hypothetical protein